MSARRILALSLVAAAALLLLAAALLWLAARTPFARQALANALAELSGRPVAVEELSLGLLPAPSVTLGGLALGQPDGFGPGPMLGVASLRLRLPWRTLFGGDPLLHEVSLRGVQLRLETLADGSDNWSALLERLAELGGEGEARWAIGRLEVEESGLLYRAAGDAGPWRLSGVALSSEDLRPATEVPLRLRLAGEQGASTFHLSIEGRATLDPDRGRYAASALQLRGWAGGEPLPLRGLELAGRIGSLAVDTEAGALLLEEAVVDAAGVSLQLRVEGRYAAEGRELRFAAASNAFSPRGTARAVGRPLPETRDAEALTALQFRAAGRLDASLLELEELEGRLDETDFGGSLRWPLAAGTPVVRLRADRIDFDRYAPPQAPRSDADATLESLVAQFGDVDLDAEVRVADAKAGGARLRGAVLRIEPQDAAP